MRFKCIKEYQYSLYPLNIAASAQTRPADATRPVVRCIRVQGGRVQTENPRTRLIKECHLLSYPNSIMQRPLCGGAPAVRCAQLQSVRARPHCRPGCRTQPPKRMPHTPAPHFHSLTVMEAHGSSNLGGLAGLVAHAVKAALMLRSADENVWRIGGHAFANTKFSSELW